MHPQIQVLVLWLGSSGRGYRIWLHDFGVRHRLLGGGRGAWFDAGSFFEFMGRLC